MNIYLDIDGVLINKKHQPLKDLEDFILEITAEHNVYWLTTHCKGDSETALNYLDGKVPDTLWPLLKRIKPTNWQTLKTEAIDFENDFVWIDDYVLEAEKKILKEKNCLEKLFLIDEKRQLKEALDRIQRNNAKQYKARTTKFRGWLLRWFPKYLLNSYAKDLGGTHAEAEAIKTLFWKDFLESRRIDLFPSGGSDGRGLKLLIDNKIYLSFTQDDDHFELSDLGFGDYGAKCEPLLFDKLSAKSDSDEELYQEAKKLVLEAGKASSGYLQRMLKISYACAARLMDMLEDEGIIGPADGAKPRDIIIDKYDKSNS